MRFTLKQGDILDEPADVLICSANPWLRLVADREQPEEFRLVSLREDHHREFQRLLADFRFSSAGETAPE